MEYAFLTALKRCCQLLVVASAGFFAAGAWAHPHSFIDMQTTLVTKDQQLLGFKMVWVMDPITSADLLYDAGNAKAGSETWKKLAAGVMARVLTQQNIAAPLLAR